MSRAELATLLTVLSKQKEPVWQIKPWVKPVVKGTLGEIVHWKD